MYDINATKIVHYEYQVYCSTLLQTTLFCDQFKWGTFQKGRMCSQLCFKHNIQIMGMNSEMYCLKNIHLAKKMPIFQEGINWQFIRSFSSFKFFPTIRIVTLMLAVRVMSTDGLPFYARKPIVWVYPNVPHLQPRSVTF